MRSPLVGQGSELRINTKSILKAWENLWSTPTLAERRDFFFSFSIVSCHYPSFFSPFLFSPNCHWIIHPILSSPFFWYMNKWLPVFWDDLEFLDSKSSSSWKLGLQCLCVHHAMDTMRICFLQTSNLLTTNSIFHIHAKLLFVWLFFWKPLFPYPVLSRGKCPNLQLHPCQDDSPVRLQQWNTSTL